MFNKFSDSYLLRAIFDFERNVRPKAELRKEAGQYNIFGKTESLKEIANRYNNAKITFNEMIELILTSFDKAVGLRKSTVNHKRQRKNSIDNEHIIPYFAANKSKMFGRQLYVFNYGIEKNFLQKLITNYKNISNDKTLHELIKIYKNKENKLPWKENTILPDDKPQIIHEKLLKIYDWDNILKVSEKSVSKQINRKESLPCLFSKPNVEIISRNTNESEGEEFLRPQDTTGGAFFTVFVVDSAENSILETAEFKLLSNWNFCADLIVSQ